LFNFGQLSISAPRLARSEGYRQRLVDKHEATIEVLAIIIHAFPALN
jgi:hypothetical protein